jgi:glycosyltransferase involved in cell wall biosynthesis
MLGFILKAQSIVQRYTSVGQPFILICHSHPTAAIAGWWLKRWREAMIIMISHGDIFDRPPNSYDRYLTWFYKVMTPRAYKRADGIVAISPHMADTIRRYGITTDKVSLIPNGIDPREIGVVENEVSRGADYGPLRLLFVGRIEPIKGLDCLVAACEELDRRGIEFTLAIAGKGSSTYVDQLKQRIQRAGLQHRIEWIGSVPREKLFSLYSQHQILVVPSINDPCPLVVLESMASGLPVVGSHVGGIPMMVEQGETGFTVPAEDPLALSNAISQLGQDRTLLAKMALNSLERAKLFSWERNVEGLSTMIDLLGQTAAVKR